MEAAVCLVSSVPHAALGNVTPYKALFGKEASLAHLRIMGARAFVPVETQTKNLDPQAWRARICGYSIDIKPFRVYNTIMKNVRESRNAAFVEIPSISRESKLTGSFDDRDFAYQEHDDLLRDVRECTSPLGLN